MLRDELAKKLGEDTVKHYPVFNHNIYEHLVYKGETQLGTPLWFNREVVNCDLKIALGGLIPYWGKGLFGGGAKMILQQEIRRGDQLLIAAKVIIAVVNRHGRPRRLPGDLARQFLA